MLIPRFVQSGWPAVLIWVLIYISDYSLTIVGARLLKTGADKHVAMEGGYELTPYYEQDIAALRRISPRFVFMLAATTGVLIVLWLASRWLGTFEGFELIFGGAFLLEVAVHQRHLRNIALLSYARDSRGISGQVEHARWLGLRLSAVDLLFWAIVYVLMFAGTNRLFFLGGALTCLTTAQNHWRRSRLSSS